MDRRCREADMIRKSTQCTASKFRGWLVVAGAFAITFVGFGSAYTFSAFVVSLQQDFGASRGSVRWFSRWPDFCTSAWGS